MILLNKIEEHLGTAWGWLHEGDDIHATSNTPAPSPSSEVIASLLNFTKIGDVRGLKMALQALIDDGKIAPETADQFNNFIDSYQINQLETLLQSYL